MKIILATDGSEQSKAAVEEVASRPFPPNTEVRIVSAYERIPLITTLEPMGVSQEFYAKADNFALKAAEDATKNRHSRRSRSIRRRFDSRWLTRLRND